MSKATLEAPQATSSRRASGWVGATFAALESPTFRLLWINSALFLGAVNLAFTAQGVVAFDITGNNGAVGLIAFSQGVAMLLATPVAGVIADGMSKRLLLALAELALGLMALSVAVLLLANSLTIVFLAAGGFIFGASVSFFWPASTAIMGDILPPERRGNGAALQQVSLNLTRSIAPFLAAGLLAWDLSGSTGTYLFIAAVFVPVLLTAWLLPATPVRPSVGRSIVREMALGYRHVVEKRALLEAMVSFIVVTLLGFSIMVVLPGLTKDVLGAGESGFGIMFGINAIGALIAGVCVTSLATSPQLPRLLTVSGVAFGLTIALTGVMPNFALACFAMLLVGAAGGMFQTLILARMIHISDAEYLGRVMSLTNLAWSLMSLLSLVIGLLADLSSQRTVLIGVGLTLVAATLALAVWSRGEDPAPKHALEPEVSPATPV